MNKRTFYKERKINNRSFDFLSKQNIIVPLILDINELYTQIFHTNVEIVFKKLDYIWILSRQSIVYAPESMN